MKIVEQPNRGTELIGVGETRNITVNADGTMIKNLITSIYSQKEKTVVRELMANALDAHAAIGLEAPIDVFLPTTFDPTFVVRDYGIGMDHKFVLDLYSVLGFSTKKDTNKQTGMFGVGSKSPLSITDTFTVRCFDKPGWNGEPYLYNDIDLNETGRIRLYTVSIGNDGIPQISHTFDVLPREGDNVERGGTEVRVPVSSHERSRILDGIVTQQFCWFDKNLNFGGAKDEVEQQLFSAVVKLTDTLYVAQGKKDSGYVVDTSWRIFARQGAAVYPISYDSVRYKLTSDAISAFRALSSHNRQVLIDLPIGTVDVTMARENIQYNETSTENLAVAMLAAVKDFEAALGELIGKSRTPIEALKKLAEKFIPEKEERTKFKSLKLVSSLLPLTAKKLRENYEAWHAAQPHEEVEVVKTDMYGATLFDTNGVELRETVKRAIPLIPPQVNPTYTLKQFCDGKAFLVPGKVYSYDGKNATVAFEDNASQIKVTFPHAFYIIPAHLPAWKDRIIAHAKKTFDGSEYPTNYREGMEIYIVRCAKGAIDGVLKFLKQTGVYMAHFTVDDLPEIKEVTVTATRNSSKTSAYRWTGSTWDDKKAEPDYDEPAYYVARVGTTHECEGRHPWRAYAGKLTPRGKYSNYDMDKLIKIGRKLGIIDVDVPIYRLTEKQAERAAQRHPKWEHLPTKVAEAAEKQIQNDPRLTLVSSDISLKTEAWSIRTMLDNVMKNSGTSEERKANLNTIYRMVSTDPLFKVVAGCRHFLNNETLYPELSFGGKVADVRELQGLVFGGVNGLDEAQIKALDTIQAAYVQRYHAVSNLGSSKYMNYYLDGMYAAEKDQLGLPKTSADLTLINKIVEAFEKKLDAIHAAVYPAPVISNDQIGAAANA